MLATNSYRRIGAIFSLIPAVNLLFTQDNKDVGAYLDPPLTEIYSQPEMLHHWVILILSVIVFITPSSFYQDKKVIDEDEPEEGADPRANRP